jgi:hypothetical protein
MKVAEQYKNKDGNVYTFDELMDYIKKLFVEHSDHEIHIYYNNSRKYIEVSVPRFAFKFYEV